MRNLIVVMAVCTLWCSVAIAVRAQEPVGEDAAGDSTGGSTGQVVDDARDKVEEIAQQVDQSQQAHEASAGILKPIYQLAEHFSFPAFHWIAFSLMVAGVVSFALQLVLAKLVVLTKFGFSITEILSDALGLVISVVGLVLTTQAATENSNFTQSPAAVLSATAVGVLVGFVFYLWGQSQELRAVEGQRTQETSKK